MYNTSTLSLAYYLALTHYSLSRIPSLSLSLSLALSLFCSLAPLSLSGPTNTPITHKKKLIDLCTTQVRSHSRTTSLLLTTLSHAYHLSLSLSLFPPSPSPPLPSPPPSPLPLLRPFRRLARGQCRTTSSTSRSSWYGGGVHRGHRGVIEGP